ncbi:polysaccharide deacetylase family protein [Halalkalibacterium halodurans]|uniref:polysaccharide deacetylase family protein n=1 Tax=Halalkalibacterium halodurans TaxID=86665 RepID=UPI00022CBBE4
MESRTETNRARRKKNKRKLAVVMLILLVATIISFDRMITREAASSDLIPDATAQEPKVKSETALAEQKDKEQESAQTESTEEGTDSNEVKSKPKENEEVQGSPTDAEPESNAGEQDGTNDKKIVYLTFDDGPTPATKKLLTLLNEYEMKATFFTLSPKVKQYPDIANQIVADGHAIALHGVTHQRERFYASAQSPLNEMVENQQTVESVTGVKTNLIRTPYGSYPHLTTEQRNILKEHGFKLWDWNVDSYDWKLRNERFVETTIEQLENQAHEASHVILFHDTETTIRHIDKLLDYLVEQGYETRLLTEDMEPIHFGTY